MEEKKYRVCEGGTCDSYANVAKDIQNKLGLENVTIDPNSRVLAYDNPKSCRVDERLLEEAAKQPGRNIRFEICE